MKYKSLGRSGLLVSDLCLGTMIFGEDSARSTPPAVGVDMIRRFLDAGGNYLDTANVYAGGRSEQIVAQAVKGMRQQVVIATKVRFGTGSGPNDQGLSRSHIMAAAEASLHRLDTDYIDLYYMHSWDPATPIEESLRALEDLVTAGKVRYLGVSNFKAWQVMKAAGVSAAHGWSPIVAGQYQYSLVKRDIEYEYIDLCLSEGVGIHPWGALGGGWLSGKYVPDVRPTTAEQGRIGVTPDEHEESWERRDNERNWRTLAVVGEIAAGHNASHSQIALAWLRGKPVVSSVILGVRTMAQLDDNLGAAEIDLSAEEMRRLDEVSAPPELYPYRLLDEQYARRMAGK